MYFHRIMSDHIQLPNIPRTKNCKIGGLFFDVLLAFLSLCLLDRKCFIHSHKWILWENDSDDIE